MHPAYLFNDSPRNYTLYNSSSSGGSSSGRCSCLLAADSYSIVIIELERITSEAAETALQR